MLQIGDIRVYLLNEHMIKVDPGGAFGLVPRALWSPLMPPDEDHLVAMCATCLLVQTADRNILVDTGYGSKLTDKQKANMRLHRPQGNLSDSLARIGLSPADIQLVIDTHLHGDHAGGKDRLGLEKHPEGNREPHREVGDVGNEVVGQQMIKDDRHRRPHQKWLTRRCPARRRQGGKG